MAASIVLFLLDQLRADAIGAAGNAFVRTPHIDRLAAASLRFETCITNAPLCRPARFSLMSGLPVAAHGYDDNRRVPHPALLPSFVRRLRDRGYHTAVVGKTHLHDGGGHLDEHHEVLAAWGFDEACELPDAQRHDVRSAHTDWLSATTPKGGLDKFRRWRDYVEHHHLAAPPPDHPPWCLSTEDHLDTFCARKAAEVLRAYRGDRPLFLQVSFPGPHPPFDPTSEFLAALDPADPAMPLPIAGACTGPISPAAARYRRRRQRRFSDAEVRRLRAAYYAKVALVDAGVGRVLEALDDTGLDDEAWILLTADHGELLGDHHLTGKVLCYESAIRVPLLVRPPGGAPGAVDDRTVDLLDVAGAIDSIAASEVWSPRAKGAAIFENMGYVAIRTPRATLAYDRRLGRAVELYDRRADPEQLANVIDDPAHRPLVAELLEELRPSW